MEGENWLSPSTDIYSIGPDFHAGLSKGGPLKVRDNGPGWLFGIKRAANRNGNLSIAEGREGTVKRKRTLQR